MGKSDSDTLLAAFQMFAKTVTEKMNQITSGESEDQLRSPFENLMTEFGKLKTRKIVPTGETLLADRLGRPDYAIHEDQLLVGYVELKAPGVGVRATRFKGHNKQQFNRFSAIPNLLYTDGNEWGLYRWGKLHQPVFRITGDVSTDGADAFSNKDARAIENLLMEYFSWEPMIPTGRKNKVDLKGFAELLAPLTRMLRDDVTDALQDSSSPLIQLAKDWRQLLFPQAKDSEFADSYAQTVTFALLLGRSEGADPLTLQSAQTQLAAHHSLLSRALQVLTDPAAQSEMPASLNLLLRVIAAVPPKTFKGTEDPWLYFYEDFLAVYDAKLRKDAGAYYTPVEVVRCQVRLVDDLLTTRLGKPRGFAQPDVVTLDPATGTGTYLLGVIEHTLERVEKEQGAGAISGVATQLAHSLYGFEQMVGPYAVSELRITNVLRDRDAELPKEGTQVYLTDTLESPHADPPLLPLYLKPISDQHAKALKVKSSKAVIVCIGNPPYDRHDAATDDNKSQTGGWVRWGDDEKGESSILSKFIEPAVKAGHGVHVKNIYNLYVYFWCWALWKTFEDKTSVGPGVVSFITGSSFLDGDGFSGMRQYMRELCDDIWIIDLGGEGRGTRKDDNIFSIQTPVCIAIAVRKKKKTGKTLANVYYAKIEGRKHEKLSQLDAIWQMSGMDWSVCDKKIMSDFRPCGTGNYFDYPQLINLFPWQHSGSQMKRTWPISFDVENLKNRWESLLNSKNMPIYFKESRDRKVIQSYQSLNGKPQKSLESTTCKDALPIFARYGYRSFDRQFVIADSRVGDYLRPDLWHTHSEKQIYFSTSLQRILDKGPALTSASYILDLNHFCNRGAKDTVPLYRNASATEPNLLPGLLELLSKQYSRKKTITPEGFASYVYGVLAQPEFTEKFSGELETRELRVPITKDGKLFEKVRKLGERLLWLHTYGERLIPKGMAKGQVPNGATKCLKAISGKEEKYPEDFEYTEATKMLRVGDGEFGPVSKAVFDFEVSGLKVVRSWLKYRMKSGAGKKSSPLDDIRPTRWTGQFTTELLELLWVLEATVTGYAVQAKLLHEVLESDCFKANELPEVPAEMKKPPKKENSSQLNMFGEEE